MAELPDLGKQCSVTVCMQLDFLPFTCDGCSKVFCSNHRTKDSHCCSKENVTEIGQEYSGPKGYTCSLSACSNRELTEIICSHCSQSFCLSHRHAQDHSCTKWVEPGKESKPSKTAEHVNHIIANKPANPVGPKKLRGGTKSSKMAAKVAFMKMKMHAQGDKGCPDEERVYINVCLPLRCKRDAVPMFFSKTWSMGRVVDSIADRIGLRNDNNCQNTQKLRLFPTDTGLLFQTDVNLGSVLSNELIYNGSSIILEYVDNDCSQLEDLKAYRLPR